MINEELMPIALNPKRWWNFYVSEDEKKEIEPILPTLSCIHYERIETFSYKDLI